jgi:AcrR family transcriptional regulator
MNDTDEDSNLPLAQINSPPVKNKDIEQKTKDEIFWAVFDTVIKLDITKGHLAWKMSDLARSSKISRTLIYYYFGKSKESTLQAAANYMGEEYFGLSEDRLALWKQGKVLESILQSRFLCLRSPHTLYFYLNWRHVDNPIGQKLREYEVRYRQKLQDYYPLSNPDQINALSAVFFGLVTTPDLTEEAVRSALVVIQENLFFAKSIK